MAKQDKLTQMQEKDSVMFREILYLSEGNRKTANRLVDAYNSNPKKFAEIIETAQHNSTLSIPEVRTFILESAWPLPPATLLYTCFGGLLYSLYSLGESIFSNGNPDKCIITYGTTMGLIATYEMMNMGIKKRAKLYNYLKEQADKNLGYKRVEGTNQLEFLLD